MTKREFVERKRFCFPAWRLAYKRDSVEKKPASLLVVSLGKALIGTPPPL